ncbi:MAG TPA: cysteine synthase family protein [Anaerolineales bacterium]|nr:cysteine synthase family protein [Anaerolineales bacterium]
MDTITFSDVQVSTSPGGVLAAHVGNTPLLRLRNLGAALSPKVALYAKAEWFNPSGSVKDRPALNILRTALAEGRLTPGKRLLDSTSGNMGIAYATLSAAMGVPVTLTVPANASAERLAILRALGAEIIKTDPLEGTDGAQRAARELAAQRPELYFYANQYDNPANWQAHYLTTGPEIVQQTRGQVTHFIAGLGISGTLTGTGRYLREYDPTIQIVAGQPDSPFHGLEGLKHIASSIEPKIFDPGLADSTTAVRTEDARRMVQRLARQEGLFVGVSSGAAAVAALQIASGLEEGMVVTVFPDAGYKYLSDQALWEQGT